MKVAAQQAFTLYELHLMAEAQEAVRRCEIDKRNELLLEAWMMKRVERVRPVDYVSPLKREILSRALRQKLIAARLFLASKKAPPLSRCEIIILDAERLARRQAL
jgi:hypothetical protein